MLNVSAHINDKRKLVSRCFVVFSFLHSCIIFHQYRIVFSVFFFFIHCLGKIQNVQLSDGVP